MYAVCTSVAGSDSVARVPTRTEPAVGDSSPARTLKIVLLPQPLGPITDTNSPAVGAKGHRIEHETRFSGRVEPLGQVLDFDHCILDHRVSHVRDLSFIAHGATMRSMANVSKYSVTLINAVTSTAANTRSVRKEFFWVLM